jgi:hypothetical protein
MQLNTDFYQQVAVINWLENAGNMELPDVPTEVILVANRHDALTMLFSTPWADALTLAQGTLTGYLAKHHYRDYGPVWNDLSKRSRAEVDVAIGDRLRQSLEDPCWKTALATLGLSTINPSTRASLGAQMAKFVENADLTGGLCFQISTNINRAALESTYKAKHQRIPCFFHTLFCIYKSGRLPCGWDGDLAEWPNGALFVH